MAFELHQQLAKDTFHVIDWPLNSVLLMNDSRYPWVILVPSKEALRDFDDVASADRAQFHDEIDKASRILRQMSGAHKMNVAALGNMVPQLHVHVIARFESDEAWPGPVWGVGAAVPYDDEAAMIFIRRFKAASESDLD